MRLVPVKTRDQQALLSLHRVRQGVAKERTALINRLRGLLAESPPTRQFIARIPLLRRVLS